MGIMEAVRKRANYSVRVKLAGRVYRIPITGGVEVKGIRQSLKTDVIALYGQHQAGAIIDVGANLGQTLLDIKAVHPGARYYGFEANPRCVSYVQDLIKANHLEDADILPIGLHEGPDLLCLYSPPSQSEATGATLIPNLRPGSAGHARQFVPVDSFDRVSTSAGIGPVAFVKIDVEGAELEVLRGMKRTLAEYGPPMFIEILPRCGSPDPAVSNERRHELAALMTGLDYSIFRVTRGPSGLQIDPVDEFDSDKYDRRKSYDYLFLPT